MPPIAQLEGTTVLFLAGLGLTCGFLLFRTHRQFNAKPKAKPSPPSTWSKSQPPAEPTAHRLCAPPEVRRWEAELHELTRELRGQLDTKIALLEHLIRDAAEQAARLEATIERATIACAGAARPAGAGPPAAHFRTPQPQAPAASAISASLTARQGEPAEAARTSRPVSSAARRHAEIYALADSGLASAAIAARIGSPIGEIDLILGLRGKS